MSESTGFNHPGLQGRLIYVRTKFRRNALNRQSVVMGNVGLEVGRIGLSANEGCVYSGNIPDLGMNGWRCQFMAGAQSRGKPTQTTAAGQWGEGVQPEPPEPSARDGGADTKKPANDPAGWPRPAARSKTSGWLQGRPSGPVWVGGRLPPRPQAACCGARLSQEGRPPTERDLPRRKRGTPRAEGPLEARSVERAQGGIDPGRPALGARAFHDSGTAKPPCDRCLTRRGRERPRSRQSTV